ncbi:MAG: hypothetical protein UZ05_CHB002000367 [Chlorobi bacterium OLB5]|nr:MAG: hypothetical protein UZ05_CHB002000367 [Chlorobi bacterium OLB5]
MTNNLLLVFTPVVGLMTNNLFINEPKSIYMHIAYISKLVYDYYSVKSFYRYPKYLIYTGTAFIVYMVYRR